VQRSDASTRAILSASMKFYLVIPRALRWAEPHGVPTLTTSATRHVNAGVDAHGHQDLRRSSRAITVASGAYGFGIFAARLSTGNLKFSFSP